MGTIARAASGLSSVKRRPKSTPWWWLALGIAPAILSTCMGEREVAAQPEVAVTEPARPKVSLSIEPGPCTGVTLEEIVPLARTELRTEVVEVERGATHHIIVGCSGDVVTIAVAAPGGRARFRSADLGGAPPNVRARIVALVAAELVRNFDLAPTPLPKAMPDSRGPSQDSRATPTNSSAQLGAFGEASSFGFDGRWLFGGGLRFEYARGWFCAGLDAAVLSGNERSDVDTTRVLVTYVSPHVDWRLMTGRAFTKVGAGFAFGAARMTGHPGDARTVGATLQGPWMAPFGSLGLGYGLTNALSIETRFIVGWVTLPVVGEAPGGREFGLQAWLSVIQVGAALSF
jgi:hypothetical protein